MIRQARFPFLILCILSAASACLGANNRPLIYGMNPTPMSWWGDPNYTDDMLFQRMREAGCTSARIGTGWDIIEPVKGSRNWSEPDAAVQRCLDNNIEPVMLINSTPEWALPADYDPNIVSYVARYPPGEDHVQDFEDYVYDLVRRYRGRVRYYEFWNEANGYGWWTALANPPSYSRADQYTPWMIRCYKALKLADPTAQMSTTGIDDGGEGHAAYFLNLIYQYGGKGYFDAVADHPYPAGGNFQSWKLDQIRQTLDDHGDRNVKVWITEFGYNWSSFTSQLSYYFNTLTQDAYDYVRIATWHTANEFPWEAGFGLMNRYLSPKPEYNTFKGLTKPSRPTVSNISVTNLSATSVRVSYSTNVAATSLVMFGPTNTYGRITPRETAAATSHQAVLTGLSPNTTYHYRIRAGAVEDGDSFSSDLTFTTSSGAAVRITSGPTVHSVSDTSATISWTTDVPSTSAVDYGINFAYGSSVSDPDLTTSHSLRLSGLAPATNYQFAVRSTAVGCADAIAEGDGFRTGYRPAALTNGGFEDGLEGWTYWEVYPWGNSHNGTVDYPGHIGYGIDSGVRFPSTPCREGYHRVTGECGWASAVGGLYQTIDCPNGPYIVSGWIATNFDGGTEVAEIVAMDGAYPGAIPAGTTIGQLTSSADWNRFANVVDVTTGQLTVALRTSQYWAVNIVTAHFDGIGVTRATRGGVGAIKSASEGTGVVSDQAKVVSAVLDAYTLYAQDENRSAGIRVVTAAPHGAKVGDRVTFCGTLALDSGEARVESAAILSSTPGDPPKPLAVRLASVGGAAQGLQPAVGSAQILSNTGLLIRTWGEVISADTSGMLIDDGSGRTVRCLLDGANALVSPGDYIACTGVSSCEMVNGEAKPLIRARSAADVRKYPR